MTFLITEIKKLLMGFNSRLGRTEEISELGDRSADKYSN